MFDKFKLANFDLNLSFQSFFSLKSLLDPHAVIFLSTKMSSLTFLMAKNEYRLSQISLFWEKMNIIWIKQNFFMGKNKYGSGHLCNYK